MEYNLSVNQKKAVEWKLSTSEALLFSYLINLGAWVKTAPDGSGYIWMANSKLAEELPIVCQHEGSARRLMASLASKELLDRKVIGNRSYFKISDKGFEWRSGTLKPNQTVRPDDEAKPNGSGKPNETVRPKPNQMVCQSLKPSLSVIPESIKDIPPATQSGGEKKPAKSTETWQAYRMAYLSRYKTEPIRGAKTNTLLCQLVDEVGVDMAPKLAAHYVSLNEAYYVRDCHPISVLRRDANKINTSYQTGLRMTSTRANQADRKENNLSVIEEVIAMRQSEGKL